MHDELEYIKMRYRSPARLSTNTTPSKTQSPTAISSTLSSQRPLVIADSPLPPRHTDEVQPPADDSLATDPLSPPEKLSHDVTHASPATLRSGDLGYESLDSRRLLLGNQQLEVSQSTVV